MLARTVLPPSVFTRAVTGNFSGRCLAALAPASAANSGAPHMAQNAAAPPTEVVLASATGLLLVVVRPPLPASDVQNAAAAAAMTFVEMNLAETSGPVDELEEETDSRACEVLCQQPAFGAVMGIAAYPHPFPASSQVGTSFDRMSLE